jgi:histidinol-phosphate phosphatase family protein
MIDRTVFLDKDGTLIDDVPYNVDPGRIRLAPGVLGGLSKLHAAGYRFIVVTNQSGVARGYFPESALIEVESRLRELLAQGGVPLERFYYCPHHPDGIVLDYAVDCSCRKPAPGLVLRASEEWNVDLRHAWLVGDILNDVECGRRAGVRTILIDNGNETEWMLSPQRQPHFTAANLLEAARIMLEEDLTRKQTQRLPKSWRLRKSGPRTLRATKNDP